ncbi:MAG: hypothetical protein J6333_01985 [Planctomycetes bacterium]|nr:hypothetical protein [Planctomycetota bacterium]
MGDLTYFYGSSQSRLSAKGQVAFPKRFRDILGDAGASLVILPGQGKCLYIYTHQQFAQVRERVRAAAVRDNDPEFFRSFMEEVSPLELDTQGRFVLNGELRAKADIAGQDLLFIGMDDRIEVWSPAERETRRRDDFAQKREERGRDIFGI